MNRGILLLLGAISAGVLVGLTLYAAREAKIADLEGASLTAKAAALKVDIDQLETARAEVDRQRARLYSASMSGAAPPRNVGLHPPPDRGAELRRDPKLQALYLETRRARIGWVYGPLFRVLQLSSDQVEKFKEIMVDHEGQEMDLSAAAESQGITNSDPITGALREQSNQEFRAAEIALLGENGYQQEQEFNRTLPVRTLVDQLAGAVAFADPLSEQQAEQMTQALANASPSYLNGLAADFSTINWAQADQMLQGILSSSQFATWQQAEPMGGGPSRWLSQFLQAERAAKGSNSMNSVP